jgi:hypothetical protein
MACATIFFAGRICVLTLGEKAETPFLLWMAAFPTFFKTAAMFSPEIFGAFFVWLGSWIAIRSWRRRGFLGAAPAAGAAACLSAAAWTRPLMATGAGAWALAMIWMTARDRAHRRQWLRATLAGGAICLIAAFSLVSLNEYRFGRWIGLPAGMERIRDFRKAAKRPSPVQSFQRQPRPLEYYFALSLDELFRRPVRPALDRHLLPVLYSDWWGDYWQYWTCNVEEKKLNQDFVTRLLAAQNAAALPGTFMLLLGLAALVGGSLKARPDAAKSALIPLAALALIAGLAYWLFISGAAFSSRRFDPVKSIYIAFLAPAAAMAGAWAIRLFFERFPKAAPVAATYLLVFAAWSFCLFAIYWH